MAALFGIHGRAAILSRRQRFGQIKHHVVVEASRSNRHAKSLKRPEWPTAPLGCIVIFSHVCGRGVNVAGRTTSAGISANVEDCYAEFNASKFPYNCV